MKGWCKNNYHTDGKRRYGFLTNGLCNECFSKNLKHSQTNKPLTINQNASENHPNVEKISAIIKEINASSKSAGMTARQGLCEIDDLGGYSILGYDTDKEYLKTEFPQLDNCWLSRQRSCGRIEKILEIPIGTYSYNKLAPLLQFRIIVPCGRTGKNVSGRFPKLETPTKQPFKENPEGIAKVKQAYQIAQQLANKSLPEGQFLEQAVAQMAEQGLAKKRSSPYKQELARKDKQWLLIIAQKEQEIKTLQARIHELESSLKILSKNELIPSQVLPTKIHELESSRKILSKNEPIPSFNGNLSSVRLLK